MLYGTEAGAEAEPTKVKLIVAFFSFNKLNAFLIKPLSALSIVLKLSIITVS